LDVGDYLFGLVDAFPIIHDNGGAFLRQPFRNRPIPFEAPVTTATFSMSDPMSSSPFSWVDSSVNN
jgi:hypothetical protein